MTISIQKISKQEQLTFAYNIRKEVFVKEQNVPAEEELDQFEQNSIHFLAFVDNIPAGTCRYRITEKGIKLERFSVLQAYRKFGVGAVLVQTALQNISENPENLHKILYLHAQVSVIPFYEKYGFVAEGAIFDECGILHRLMKYQYAK